MTSAFTPGLELARRFYAELVGPVLAAALDGVPHSAAMIGWGSDVQGFDTVRSTDHAWGPRLHVFLSGDDFSRRSKALDAALYRELPEEFGGYPVRFPFPPDIPDRHWVEIHEPRAYFTGLLGADPEQGLSTHDWLGVPTQTLRELTGGAVFHDGLGRLEPYRRALTWYPDDVWRYVLACQWMRLDQEEPFVGRCGEAGDDLGSAVVAARQVRDLMKLCLLMHRSYPPYSKWLGTAFSRLPCAKELSPLLSAALAATKWEERERHLSPAYELAARLHNDLALTEPLDTRIQYFHGRPFRVLNSRRFTAALLDTVTDPEIKQLPPVGAFDQYVDSTDMISTERRRRYLR